MLFSSKEPVVNTNIDKQQWQKKKIQIFLLYCSDFRYESNGIFVLGVGFFSSDINE